jgi:hypothetical protein
MKLNNYAKTFVAPVKVNDNPLNALTDFILIFPRLLYCLSKCR